MGKRHSRQRWQPEQRLGGHLCMGRREERLLPPYGKGPAASEASTSKGGVAWPSESLFELVFNL